MDLSNLDADQLQDLWDLVHDVAAEVASNANNNGESVDFLLMHGWTQEQIIARLEAK